jgi:hypothetical protein
MRHFAALGSKVQCVVRGTRVDLHTTTLGLVTDKTAVFRATLRDIDVVELGIDSGSMLRVLTERWREVVHDQYFTEDEGVRSFCPEYFPQ